jgi:hypothetical protein
LTHLWPFSFLQFVSYAPGSTIVDLKMTSDAGDMLQIAAKESMLTRNHYPRSIVRVLSAIIVLSPPCQFSWERIRV